MIQCLDDRQADGADILEGPLGRRVTTGSILPEVAPDSLEALVGLPALCIRPPSLFVRPAALFIRAPAIGSHLQAQVAQLFQDQPDARFEEVIVG